MLANNFSTSVCFAIFELIKFMCFGSTLIYPHEEFLILHPQQVQPAPALPCSKINPHAKQCGFEYPPANVGTRNLHGLTRPVQDSTASDLQRDVHSECPKVSLTIWLIATWTVSLPSCPSTAVAQRRVNKEMVKMSGKRCSFCGRQFHPRYTCESILSHWNFLVILS